MRQLHRELRHAEMDQGSLLEVWVQHVPQKEGEAEGKHSKEITLGEWRSESHTQNLGQGETWAVPV